MRDPQAYVREGRSDPTAPDQLQEHPYDFVSLPATPAQGAAVGHHRDHDDRLYGRLVFTYETLTPLHVGSGAFESVEECGLGPGDAPVRGIIRRRGKPVLPGSSWKGAVRSHFEAITRSRLTAVSTTGKLPRFKVPGALADPGYQGKHRVVIDDPRLGALERSSTIKSSGDEREAERAIARLDPAEALFGALGYRGRVHPDDGEIRGPAATEPLHVAPMESPAPHRLAKPGKASAGRTIRIAEVEGRKFYYDGDVVHSRGEGGGSYEPVDHVPAGSTVEIPVYLEAVTRAELGALLVAAGHAEAAGVLRFGGFKPAGLGKVRLTGVAGELGAGPARRSWRRPSGEPIDPDAAVAAAKAALIDSGALAELHSVTTRRRPTP